MATIERVSIQGEGIAARCCSHLLAQGGVAVHVELRGRAQVPAIMMSDAAVGLVRDAFGNQGLLTGLPRITRRFVLWGDAAEPVELEHSAVVVSEERLLRGLGPEGENGVAGDWTVHATRPVPAAAVDQRFGDRRAAAVSVQLRESAAGNACWIEALPEGWLFLITVAPGQAWLLSVGGPADEMLGRSRMVGACVGRLGEAQGNFACSPRMLAPVGGERWLACGSAAMAFDPLCGDGTAHAVREAILASAVIRAIRDGGDEGALLRHYQGRLLAGFQKHLEMCLRFYESGSESEWWRAQAGSVREGIRWCRAQDAGGNEYRLRGFDLEPVR